MSIRINHVASLVVRSNQSDSRFVLFVDGVAIKLFSRLRDYFRRSFSNLLFSDCRVAWIEDRFTGEKIAQVVSTIAGVRSFSKFNSLTNV